MFVVVWEPKHGRGGGHQAVMDQRKAEQVRQAVTLTMPDVNVRLLPAEHSGAAAVLERQRRSA
jgi:hypothetical protein